MPIHLVLNSVKSARVESLLDTFSPSVIYVLSRMAKQKVTLSLDSQIYQRTREILKDIPGNPSVSGLIDELLDGFTKTLQAPLKALGEGATAGDSLMLLHSGVAEIIRTLHEEDEEPHKPKK